MKQVRFLIEPFGNSQTFMMAFLGLQAQFQVKKLQFDTIVNKEKEIVLQKKTLES